MAAWVTVFTLCSLLFTLWSSLSLSHTHFLRPLGTSLAVRPGGALVIVTARRCEQMPCGRGIECHVARGAAQEGRQPSVCAPCMPRPPADRSVSLGWYNAAVPWRLEPARSAARAGRGAAVEASARATSLLRRSVARACATRSRSMLHREDWSTTLAQRAGCGKALSGRNEARGRWARHVKMGVVESENAF